MKAEGWELDETMYWLLIESKIVSAARIRALSEEENQPMSILETSVLTVKERRRRPGEPVRRASSSFIVR